MERHASFSLTTPTTPNGGQYSTTPSVISTSTTTNPTSGGSVGFGSSGKFVRRLEALERENMQLKAKVESLEVWQTVVQNWMMENFGVQYTESVTSEQSNVSTFKNENQERNGDRDSPDLDDSESGRDTPSDLGLGFNRHDDIHQDKPSTSARANQNNGDVTRNGDFSVDSDTASTVTSQLPSTPRTPRKNKIPQKESATPDTTPRKNKSPVRRGITPTPSPRKNKNVEKNAKHESSARMSGSTRAISISPVKSSPATPRKNKNIEKKNERNEASTSGTNRATEITPVKFTPEPPRQEKKKAKVERLTNIDSASRNDSTVGTATFSSSSSETLSPENMDQSPSSPTNEEEPEWGIIENVYTAGRDQEQKDVTPSPPVSDCGSDDTPCDVCGSPTPEDGNQMVYCDGDGCNICVHQACYGVHEVPAGVWKCRTCAKGIKPSTQDCLFCPKKGGAMTPCKSPSGKQWAHVSCALWIPEVTFGSPERMEPVIKIPEIPKRRWTLTCSLCSSKKGAPIQCYHKKCLTAFHVTCAYDKGLKMDMDDSTPDGRIQMEAFCNVHANVQRTKSPPPKRRKIQNQNGRQRSQHKK